MRTQEKRLTAVNQEWHPRFTPEKDGVGFDSPKNRSAQPRRAVFLCVSPLHTFFYGWASVGERSRSPVPSVPGLSTLPCARPPHLTVDGGPSNRTEGARHAC